MPESNATVIIKPPIFSSGNVKNNITYHADFSTVPHATEAELDQAYYWTKDWQEGESRADKDITAGNWDIFPSAKDAIEYLHKLKDDTNKSD